MRNEPFDNTKPGYETDDIKYAFEHNGLASRLNDIAVIVAEVPGENDGYKWYWILQMKDGTFSAAEGGCDYTGWDCRSHATITDGFKTPEEAVESIEIDEWDSREASVIKSCLLRQLAGSLPFAVFEPEPRIRPAGEERGN